MLSSRRDSGRHDRNGDWAAELVEARPSVKRPLAAARAAELLTNGLALLGGRRLVGGFALRELDLDALGLDQNAELQSIARRRRMTSCTGFLA